MLGFDAIGLGSCDALQPFGPALPEPLVGFPSLFSALLVDVVGRIRHLPVALAPGGDALVDGVGVAVPAALGESRFPVKHFDGVVVGGVLLSSVVADGLAVGGGTPQGKFRRADHIGPLCSDLRLLLPFVVAVCVGSEYVVASYWNAPLWHAIFQTEHQLLCKRGWVVSICVSQFPCNWLLP